MSDTNTAAFCWVKAVLKNPPSMAEPALDAQPVDHPLLEGLRSRCAPLADLTPPPAPKSVLLADFKSKLGSLGVKVPPPSADEIPKAPRPSGAPVMPSAPSSALPIPGYWQQVSYMPGVEPVPGQPVVTLVFQPVPGPRDEAELWRNANPLWFCDAFAATLLNHGI